MAKKTQSRNAISDGELERKRSSKAVEKKQSKESKKQPMKTTHNHELPMQEKLKDKNWDPIKEMLEITDEYEAGTPKREGGKDYWGACCLESQDVDVAQKTDKDKKPKQARPIPK